MTIIRVIDTETTGFPEEGKPAGILEIGWTDVTFDDLSYTVAGIGLPISHLCNPFRGNPELEIDPGASAAHHIIREDVENADPPDVAFRHAMKGADIFAAHNKEFDSQFFPGGGKPFVCTLRIARRMLPDMARHTNQYLRYALNLPVDRKLANDTHRAGSDAYVTAHLLAHFFGMGVTMDDMIRITDAPMLLHKMPFGKHKGMLMSEVPQSYLNWLDGTELDRDMRHTLRHEMKQRGFRAR